MLSNSSFSVIEIVLNVLFHLQLPEHYELYDSVLHQNPYFVHHMLLVLSFVILKIRIIFLLQIFLLFLAHLSRRLTR